MHPYDVAGDGGANIMGEWHGGSQWNDGGARLYGDLGAQFGDGSAQYFGNGGFGSLPSHSPWPFASHPANVGTPQEYHEQPWGMEPSSLASFPVDAGEQLGYAHRHAWGLTGCYDSTRMGAPPMTGSTPGLMSVQDVAAAGPPGVFLPQEAAAAGPPGVFVPQALRRGQALPIGEQSMKIKELDQAWPPPPLPVDGKPVQSNELDQEVVVKTGRRRRKRKKKKSRVRRRPMRCDEDPLDVTPLEIGGVSGPLSLSNAENGWESGLFDEKRRSFISMRSGAFPDSLLAEWWECLSSRIPWARPWTRMPAKEERLLPRSACWFTDAGCMCKYDYGSTSFPPIPVPAWLDTITERVCDACGLACRPNSVNVNRYESGSDAVGWHSDNEPLFEACDHDSLIISLSLGASRTFRLRPNDDPTQVTSLLLKHGDLCTMEGRCQKHFRHCVPLEPETQSPRINLTWRWVRRHQSSCPLHVPRDDEDAGGGGRSSPSASGDDELSPASDEDLGFAEGSRG
eukprot:TRINITY_DN32940_c0_g1_i1.p1 TRINITY_DN32940_c0_g1~~TRINITY_DN32940_c0_g1_i1.p1  ORF type:complete len:538 (+),score=86.95 TRINITY_DN32940_c0_g1_i1:81-1616(+)